MGKCKAAACGSKRHRYSNLRGVNKIWSINQKGAKNQTSSILLQQRKSNAPEQKYKISIIVHPTVLYYSQHNIDAKVKSVMN